MFGVVNFAEYCLGALFIILLPGPNSLYVLSAASDQGRRAGTLAALGVLLADTILITLTALGAAAVLKAYPLLFQTIQYLGGAYLAWMAFGMMQGAWIGWRTRHLALSAEAPERAMQKTSLFIKAFTIGLFNPKAIVFLLSFFVRFVDSNYAQPLISFAILGGTLQVFSALYLGVLIFSGHRLAAFFRQKRGLSAGLLCLTGSLFLYFAAQLVLARL